ncbi:MAG: RDD family protein [Terriglobales bacterium]
MTTGNTITELTATGLTNRPTGGDIAIPPPLCPPQAVEQTRSNVAEAAPSEPKSDSWRDEVAARLERYRTRRKPRTPRYPSLLLPFDSPESWFRPAPLNSSAKTGSPEWGLVETGSAALATAPARAEQDSTLEAKQERTALAEPTFAEPRQIPDQSAKVIEFPRSAAIPVFHPSDLADPVFDLDRPRIVEAPEILPPPPALGGMLIEPAHQEPADRRVDIPSAFPSASIARRTLAALMDGAILATALTAFAVIFLRLNPSLNPVRGPLPLLAAALGVAAAVLWAVYEFLFVVYTGSTPGLRAARLRLAAFDGTPLNRRARRWRVLASFLSAFSAGLGYLWCVLDQDGLCWHDRITRTHVQSAAQPE